MLLILLILFLIVGIGLVVWNDSDGLLALGIVMLVIVGFGFLISGATYSDSYTTVNDMRELARQGVSFEQLEQDTMEYINLPGIKQEQINKVMIGFAFKYQKYEQYNEDYYRLKRYNSGNWLNLNYANLPEWIKPIS